MRHGYVFQEIKKKPPPPGGGVRSTFASSSAGVVVPARLRPQWRLRAGAGQGEGCGGLRAGAGQEASGVFARGGGDVSVLLLTAGCAGSRSAMSADGTRRGVVCDGGERDVGGRHAWKVAGARRQARSGRGGGRPVDDGEWRSVYGGARSRRAAYRPSVRADIGQCRRGRLRPRGLLPLIPHAPLSPRSTQGGSTLLPRRRRIHRPGSTLGALPCWPTPGAPSSPARTMASSPLLSWLHAGFLFRATSPRSFLASTFVSTERG